MTDTNLKDVVKRAEAWPAEDQRKLIAAARLIEAQRASGFDLDESDWVIIDRRVEEAKQGAIAPESEAEAFFAKYRMV